MAIAFRLKIHKSLCSFSKIITMNEICKKQTFVGQRACWSWSCSFFSVIIQKPEEKIMLSFYRGNQGDASNLVRTANIVHCRIRTRVANARAHDKTMQDCMHHGTNDIGIGRTTITPSKWAYRERVGKQKMCSSPRLAGYFVFKVLYMCKPNYYRNTVILERSHLSA